MSPIEQNVRKGLKMGDRVAVMKAGAVTLEAAAAELADNARLVDLYGRPAAGAAIASRVRPCHGALVPPGRGRALSTRGSC
jgi:hypothetical protein